MFESVKKKIRIHPFFWRYHFQQIESRRWGGGTLWRRSIMLIYAGWLPHDLFSSWSCLSLSQREFEIPLAATEGSPYRGSPPQQAWKIYFYIQAVVCWTSLSMAQIKALNASIVFNFKRYQEKTGWDGDLKEGGLISTISAAVRLVQTLSNLNTIVFFIGF